jgi:hypothetical protein
MLKTTAALPSTRQRLRLTCNPPFNPNSILLTLMSYDITPGNPEMISDEQLEDVAGGLADVENNSCVALYQATAQINL